MLALVSCYVDSMTLVTATVDLIEQLFDEMAKRDNADAFFTVFSETPEILDSLLTVIHLPK